MQSPHCVADSLSTWTITCAQTLNLGAALLLRLAHCIQQAGCPYGAWSSPTSLGWWSATCSSSPAALLCACLVGSRPGWMGASSWDCSPSSLVSATACNLSGFSTLLTSAVVRCIGQYCQLIAHAVLAALPHWLACLSSTHAMHMHMLLPLVWCGRYLGIQAWQVAANAQRLSLTQTPAPASNLNQDTTWQRQARHPLTHCYQTVRCPLPAAAAVLLHLLFSTFLWMPSYYSKLWDNTDVAVVPALNGTKLDKFGLMKTSNLPKFPTGMQVVFGDELLHYQTANGTVLSTWPVQGPRHPAGAAGELTATHPAEVLTTAVNIITLRSKLNCELGGVGRGLWWGGGKGVSKYMIPVKPTSELELSGAIAVWVCTLVDTKPGACV